MAEPNEAGLPNGSIGQRLEQIAEGGLLRLLVSKPIQQAIGRLVFGLADVPVAYLEKWSESIRSDTRAKKQITSSLASAARTIAVNDPELVQRGVDRWTRQLQEKQRTREDVALRALEILGEGEEISGAETPSEDFMRMFEDIVDKISSEKLSDLMARILAGEVRKNGSVSRRTLQVVAVLDQEIVSALVELRPYLLYPNWLHIPKSKQGPWRKYLALLSSVSIIDDTKIRTIKMDVDNKCAVAIGGFGVVITTEQSIMGGWIIEGANLTPIGDELISLLPLPDLPKVKEVAMGFKEYDFVIKVEIGDFSSSDNRITFSNLEEVA